MATYLPPWTWKGQTGSRCSSEPVFGSQTNRILSNGTLFHDIARAEAEGKVILSMVPFDEQDEPLWKAMRRIESMEAVYGILPIDDSETWIVVVDNVRSGKSIQPEGTSSGHETTHQDILGYCRASQIAIAAAKQNAGQRARISSQAAWRNISGEISHRLDNILPFTLSAVKRLIRDVDALAHHEKLLRIQSDLRRANQLIREFTRYAAPITSSPAKMPCVQVAEFLRRIKSRIDPIVTVTLQDVKEHLAHLWLRVDEQLIQDCFGQLAVNADMHSKVNPPSCVIAANDFVSARERFLLKLWEGHWLEILFSDSGIGIDKQFKERIFDPLFTRHKEGTGMGLAIARRVVEAHGGRIREVGTLNKGAVFSIILPLFLKRTE